MYLFALFVIDTLKNTGMVREDFDTYNLDLTLVETFDYDAFATEYKAHFKKPRANKILKHSSQAVRDTSDDVIINVANEYYENIRFDISAAVGATAAGGDVGAGGAGGTGGAVEEVVGVADENPKPKRKYSRKPKAAATAAVTDVTIDELTAALDNMIIQTETIAAAVAAVADDEKPKPKRKSNANRKPKAAVTDDARPSTPILHDPADAAVDDKPNANGKPKANRKPKAAAAAIASAAVADEVVTSAVADEVVAVASVVVDDKPKANRKPKAAVEAADEVTEVHGDVYVSENGKKNRKYTRKTAIQYIDETVPEFTAKIVVAAISGETDTNVIPVVAEKKVKANAKANAKAKTKKGKDSETATTTATTDDAKPNTPTLVIDTAATAAAATAATDDARPSTPILHVENELTTEDDYINEVSAAYYKEDQEDDEGEDEDVMVTTRKYNIRGTDYLIGENDVVYDFETQNTIGKFDSNVGVILYNK